MTGRGHDWPTGRGKETIHDIMAAYSLLSEIGGGVPSLKFQVSRDLGSHDTMKIRRPSPLIRKGMSARERLQVSCSKFQEF